MKPRYEFKYLIAKEKIPDFLDELGDDVEPDPQYPNGYRVSSIYYDTDDFQYYFEKLDGLDPRYKVRVRWYDDDPSSGLHVEIKHRRDQLVCKDRVTIPGRLIEELYEQRDFTLQLNEYCDADSLYKAEIVQRHIMRDAPSARCVIRYHRQVYLCRIQPQMRITIDTDLRVLGMSDAQNNRDREGLEFCTSELAVLEIKFNFAMPIWLGDICRNQGLGLRRYSKYCSGLEALYPQIAERSVRRQNILAK